MTTPFALATRNLWRNPYRTQIAVAAIAFGIAAFIVAGGFIEWILVNFREDTIHSFLGHVQISRPGYVTGTSADSFKNLLPERPELEKAVRSTPHVAELAPRLSFQGLASNGEATLSFIGDGVDPAREADLSRRLTILEGTGLSANDNNGAIVGEGLARSLGVSPGNTLVLVANTASGGVNGVEVTVRGVFTSVTKAYDDSALRVPIALARRLLRVTGAHLWVIGLDRTESTDDAVLALRTQLPEKDYLVRPWYAIADFYNKTVEFYRMQLHVVRAIIAIIIILSISNTITLSVRERTGEIGTALALGASPGRLLRDFMVEALVLGMIGGIIGVALGSAVAGVASFLGIPMPPSPGMRHGFTAGILITGRIAAEAVAFAIATTLIAAIYPAWKATRLAVVEALRYSA